MHKNSTSYCDTRVSTYAKVILSTHISNNSFLTHFCPSSDIQSHNPTRQGNPVKLRCVTHTDQTFTISLPPALSFYLFYPISHFPFSFLPFYLFCQIPTSPFSWACCHISKTPFSLRIMKRVTSINEVSYSTPPAPHGVHKCHCSNLQME